mmetsp:Transcript_102995/g.296604  ORF Transcript_102995/g.296604 Transcript_102995/m.296604 type:complete len:517 (+) Transcript_102995:193-1743(+)
MVLQKPIAVSMERRDVLHRGHVLLGGACLLLLLRLKGLLRGRLGRGLLGQELRVRGALIGGVGEHLFVINLSVLLGHLGLLHLLVELFHEEVNHGDNAVALLGLPLVGSKGLRRGHRRLPARMRADLDEGADAGASDASGSGRRQRAAHVHRDALLLRELALRRCLVKLRVIKLVQAIFCPSEDLLCRRVGLDEGLVLGILSLALLRRLGNGLVERLDAGLELGDLLRERSDETRHLIDGGLGILDRLLEHLPFVVGLIELALAVLLFRVILRLLSLQIRHHVVNHFDDLLEADTLAVQCQSDEVQARRGSSAAGRRRTHQLERARPLGGGGHGNLDQARTRAWQRGLEQIQSIVIVEDLDGLGQCEQLLGPGLLHLLPLSLLRGAALLQLSLERLIRGQGLLSVLNVVAHLRDADAQVADASHFILDLRLKRGDLLLLRHHELLEVLDGGHLRLRGVAEALGHLIGDLLQNTDDLTGLGDISSALRPGQEGQKLLTGFVWDVGLLHRIVADEARG